MLNIKHILFPIDFSERCCSAVPFVESMATRFGARITLITVTQPFSYVAMGDPGSAVVVDTDALMRDLKARIDTALTHDFSHLTVDRIAELGDPAQIITDFAHSHDVDLIMMPTHGYGLFRSLLLGSVTAKVLHDAQCPVWTAAHVAERPCRDHIACRNILCAVDGEPLSGGLMKWAAEFAKDEGATLRFVHVIPGMEGFPSRQMDLEFEEERRKNAAHAISELQASSGVDAPLCIAVGKIPESVRIEARRHRSDLVVIGRGTIHEALGRLRTHAYGIIRQSPCPVLSV